MVRIGLAITLTFGAGLMVADAAMGQDQPVPAASRPAVSADHVREGLQRPQLVVPQVPIQEPTFRSGVTEKLETPLDVIRRELREEARLHPWQSGYMAGQDPKGPRGLIAEVDVWPALMSLVTKVRTIRREHAEAEARQMVQQELAAFCAQHDCSQAATLPIDEGILVPTH